MGFRLRKVVKAKPAKQLQETDALFDKMQKKTNTPGRRAASNACVSMVKRRSTLANLHAVASPVATTKRRIDRELLANGIEPGSRYGVQRAR